MRKLWIALVCGLSFINSPSLWANGEDTGIAHRVAALEQQVAALMTELDRVSPDTDLTGKTYCVVGQGNWLAAGNGSAYVVANPYSTRVDFTSATEFTATDLYDPYSWIALPDYVMGDDDDSSPPVQGTYAIVGSQLTVNIGGEVGSFHMTPNAQVFIRGDFERSVSGGVDWWETEMLIGVQATSCD